MEKVNQLLELLTSLIKESSDFVVAQAPEVIQEILRWEFWLASIWMALFLLLFLAGSLTAKSMWKNCVEKDHPGIILNLAAMIGGVIGFVFNTLRVVQILVAPKLFLLSYAADLLKK